jgi:hypothetical protein
MRGLALNGSACVTYINIAKWDSWEAFSKEFDTSKPGFNPDIETAPRQRAILDVIV